MKHLATQRLSSLTRCSLLVGLLSVSGALSAEVLITEVMYNPAQGKEYEYVELHNRGAADENISGWSLKLAVEYVFPPETVIPPGGFLVVGRDLATLRTAYPSLPEEILLGNYAGGLANEGEILSLNNAEGQLVDAVAYDDDPPWEFLADGFGASLERICFTASASLPENWRASPIPASLETPGGTPGEANSLSLCPPTAPVKPRVLISEIMYHAVLEEWYEDRHEFIEISNREASAVDLGGWRIAGAVDYEFPPGASLASGGYAIIAKDKNRLAAVSAYGLDAGDLFGNYSRTLDNGGEKIALISAAGQGVDSVSYDDDFPWPVGADALGAGRTWLDPSLLPLEDHRYMGHSLERVSFDHASGEISNWAPSPLDGATPGGPNASARAVPFPVVEDLFLQPWGGEGSVIRSNDEAWLQVRFSQSGPVSSALLQYFIDDVTHTNEATLSVDLKDDGTDGDVVAGDNVFSVVLPPRPTNSIVRYRILADRVAGLEQVSPRPTDPYEWHAYFVSPVINTETRLYQIFISPTNWGNMYRNAEGGRVSGCEPRDEWEAKVPAVLIYKGQVIDAHVRYHGSRYNRRNGPNISWPYPGPNYGPTRALSWRIGLPRYAQIDGSGTIILNKNTQGCPGYTAGVGYRLFALGDVPSPKTRYARLHVNGGYYHYMVQYEHVGEDLVRRHNAEQAAKYPDLPKEEIGNMFKSSGCNCDEGPFGWGDERALSSHCGHSKEARYMYTYERKTHRWDDHTELISMIEDLNVARNSLPNTAALRAFFEERFDLEILLNYIAIMNWAVPFDDMFQNHYVYQRFSDGKWVVTPWDLDRNFGVWKGSSASIYMGERNDPDNRSGWWNYLKDGFLKAYRSEFEARLVELSSSILHPDFVSELVDEVTAEANPTEAGQAPAGVACSFTSSASNFKSFARSRHSIVLDRLSTVRAAAGPDQTVVAGSVVQFDARASRPDPGADATYTWDNGMTGDYPSAVFATPGEYTVTLTITTGGVPYRDSVKITVIPAPERAFAERGGQVVFEAEHFYVNDRHGASQTWWEEDTSEGGFSGNGYMDAKDTTFQKFSADYADVAPELRYTVLFETTGTYRVWIRGLSSSNEYDSCHVGLDGSARDESFAQRFVVQPGSFLWAVGTRSQGPQEVTVTSPGVHFLSIWIRESGQLIDKIILTKNTSYTPSGAGPAESEEVSLSSHPAFVRGDSNGDGLVDISDPVGVLLHLFDGAGTVSCDDHGDFDDNGSLQVTDAIGALAYLFQGGPAPPAPFPAPGQDPTPDGEECGDP